MSGQGKPGKGMDAYDVQYDVKIAEPSPGAHAYMLMSDGCHQLIGDVYTDEDGDLIFLEEGGSRQ